MFLITLEDFALHSTSLRFNDEIVKFSNQNPQIRQFLSYFKFNLPPLTSALKKLSKIKSFFVVLSATVEELIYCYSTEFAIRQLNFKPGSTNGRRLIINSNQFTKATQFGKYRKWFARAVHKLAIIKKLLFSGWMFASYSRRIPEESLNLKFWANKLIFFRWSKQQNVDLSKLLRCWFLNQIVVFTAPDTSHKLLAAWTQK